MCVRFNVFILIDQSGYETSFICNTLNVYPLAFVLINHFFENISKISLDCRLELVKLYYGNYENATATMKSYKTRDNLKWDHIKSTITRLIEWFETTKEMHDIPPSGKNSLEAKRTPQVMHILSII